ncbi:hypothetical protein J6Z48_01610 [bacterium]|nr:hypothetical protein [bacterium]
MINYLVKNNKRYRAMGFIDVLIAIVVIGILSVVLMQIASNTFTKMVKNEQIDNMTQYGYEGGIALQDIATRDRDYYDNEKIFPTGKSGCMYFFIQKDSSGNYSFVRDGDYFLCEKSSKSYKEVRTSCIGGEYERGSEHACYITHKTGNDYQDVDLAKNPVFFRIVELDFSSEVDRYVLAKVHIGQIGNKDGLASGNYVSDYVYYATIKL